MDILRFTIHRYCPLSLNVSGENLMVKVVVVGVVSCVTIGNSLLPSLTFIQVTLGRGVRSDAIVTVHMREKV